MKKIKGLFLLAGIFFLNHLTAYELINVPQLAIRIEDGNGYTIQQVTFNGQNITLEESGGPGRARQIATYSVRPDSYIILWTATRQRGRNEEVSTFEKLLYIVKGDDNVQIRIQGDRIQ
jgi:hypothetical protein